VTVTEALNDAQALSRSDLRSKYVGSSQEAAGDANFTEAQEGQEVTERELVMAAGPLGALPPMKAVRSASG